MKTMNLAAVVIFSALPAAHAQQAVPWMVEEGGNGHWYQLQALSLPRDHASAAARTMGAELASITSIGENEFVQALAAGSSCWIAGDQPAGACEPGCWWGWLDGEPWGFTRWDLSTGEPNDGGGTVPGEQGIEFRPSGYWNDYWTWRSLPSIVEWSADCNGDGVVDYGQCRDGSLADFNGNNIPDCCEAGTPCVTGSYPLQWRATEGGNSHWYLALLDGFVQNWDHAKVIADSAGGYLASVTSVAESEFVWSRLASNPNRWTFQSNFSGPALGGYLDGGRWRWLSGEPWDFATWGPCFSHGGEQRLHFGCNALSNEWNDLWNWDSNIGGAIIEWSTDCNRDGVVDYGQILQRQLPDANVNGVPDRCECIAHPSLPACCTGNLNLDAVVDGADLGMLLFGWGAAGMSPSADLNDDGIVDGSDLGLLLAAWGPCLN